MPPLSGSHAGKTADGRTGGPPDRNTATRPTARDRKSTRLNSSHSQISYAVFSLNKKEKSPGAHRDDLALLRLLLRRIGKHDPAPRRLFTLGSLHDHLITQRSDQRSHPPFFGDGP